MFMNAKLRKILQNKRIIGYLITFIVVNVIMVIVVNNSGVGINEVSGFVEERELLPENALGVSGYEITGDFYDDIDGDPWISFPNINMDIESIRVNFSEPLDAEMNVQIYYAGESGMINEYYSLHTFFHEGVKEGYVDMPFLDDCYLLRFDMNGDFSLDSISLSSKDYKLDYRGKSKQPIWLYSVISFFLLIIFVVLYKVELDILTWNRIKSIKILTVVFDIMAVISFLSVYFSMRSVNKHLGFFIACIAFSILFIIGHIKTIDKDLPLVSMVILVVLGLMCIYTLPDGLYVGPDDEIHYARSSYLSHVGDRQVSLSEELYQTRMINPTSDGDYLKLQWESLENLYKNGFSYTLASIDGNIFTIVAYIPAALGMIVARGLNLTFRSVTLFGRLFNLLFYSFLIYLSLRNIKKGRLALAVFAMFPTNVFLASVYSYDSWITGFTVLGCSFVLRALENRETTNTKCFIGSVISFVLAFSPKPVYFPLVFISLIILSSKEKVSERLIKVLSSFAGAALLLLSFLLPFLSNSSSYEDPRMEGAVDSAAQIRFIFSNPLEYLKILGKHLNSIFDINSHNSSIGAYGHLGNTGSLAILLIIFTCAIILDSEIDYGSKGIRQRALVIICSIAAMAIMSSALYVGFTPVAEGSIFGFQLRYLIPVYIPIAWFVLSPRRQLSVNRRFLYTSSIAFAAISLYIDAWYIWMPLHM